MDSTLRHVPLEIWQKIFQLVLASERVPVLGEAELQGLRYWSCQWGRVKLQGPSKLLILPRAPSTLSSVCTEWRSCAYGMPDMWNTLFVTVPKAMDQEDAIVQTLPQILELVEARLALTQSMPLKICLVSKNNAEFGRAIIRAVIPYSRQWETIHFYTPPEVYSKLKGLRAADFPNLFSFNIILEAHVSRKFEAHNTEVFFDKIPIFNEASSIRRFNASLFPLSTSPIYCELQELHIRGFEIETWALAPVLERCSHLRVLTLSGFGATSHLPFPFNPQQITLPKLETLILENPRGRERLLELLILPNIKSLLLGGETDLFGHSTVSIFNAIERLKGRSKVESFEHVWIYYDTHGMHIHPTMLVNFLSQNHSIREIRIDDHMMLKIRDSVTPSFFAALAGRNYGSSDGQSDDIRPTHRPFLCPNLESLHLVAYHESPIIENNLELEAFLEARCMGQSELGKDGLRTSCALMPVVHLEISIKRVRDESLPVVPDVVKEWKEKGYLVDVNVVDAR